MNLSPLPHAFADPADPFFTGAQVVGQFRRHPFFCVRCSRREGPPLHQEGVLLLIGNRYFAVDFSCFAKLELPYRGEMLSEGRARRVLPFVRYRTGTREEDPPAERPPAEDEENAENAAPSTNAP